jgi:hypothetical protein
MIFDWASAQNDESSNEQMFFALQNEQVKSLFALIASFFLRVGPLCLGEIEGVSVNRTHLVLAANYGLARLQMIWSLSRAHVAAGAPTSLRFSPERP